MKQGTDRFYKLTWVVRLLFILTISVIIWIGGDEMLFGKQKEQPVDDAVYYRKVKTFCQDHQIKKLFDFISKVRNMDPDLYKWCMQPNGFGFRMDTCRGIIRNLWDKSS